MSLESGRRPLLLEDPSRMRALAHPVRLALHELLMRAGPTTAAEAGRRIGISQALASYHLRQLDRYGFVEQAPARDERERPWQAASTLQSWVEPVDEAGRAARGQLEQVMVERALGRLAEWQEHRTGHGSGWRGLGGVGNSLLYLTPEEFRSLHRRLNALLDPFQSRVDDPATRPPTARPVSFTYLSVPLPAVDGAEKGNGS